MKPSISEPRRIFRKPDCLLKGQFGRKIGVLLVAIACVLVLHVAQAMPGESFVVLKFIISVLRW